MYISTTQWRDLRDGHLYEAGEPFPHDGREIPEERIAELTTTQNKAGFALIKAVQTPDDKKPKQAPKTAKTAVKSPKKGK